MQKATYSIPEFAELLGVSRSFAYRTAQATGELAGVPVIRLGSRLVLPREACDRVLRGEVREAAAV